jgi:hypothetical protein
MRVVTFDGGGWVIGLAALERAGRDHLLVRPAAVDDAVEGRSGPSAWPPSSTPRPRPGAPRVRPVHDSWTYEARAIQLDSLHDEPSGRATG